MNVEQKKIDALNCELVLTVAADDYAALYKKKFNDVKRKADFKGFRKGMVPASLIQKVYGEQILVESVNQTVGQALENHISENKLHILGEPLGSEKQPEIEWVNGNDFTFIFDIALAPEVAFEVEKSDVVPHYSVTIAAKDKAPMIESLKKYYEEKNEEKTDADIEKEVTERMKDQYKQEAEWRLSKDIRDFYVAKAALQLPEEFLKRWLFSANEGKFSKEEIEKEFPGFAADFKWQMVRGYLMQKWGFKVEEKDIREAANAYVAYQYAMYGMGGVPQEFIEQAAVDVLKDQKQVERLAEQVEDQKVLAKIKEEITLKATKISAAKFRELK